MKNKYIILWLCSVIVAFMIGWTCNYASEPPIVVYTPTYAPKIDSINTKYEVKKDSVQALDTGTQFNWLDSVLGARYAH